MTKPSPTSIHMPAIALIRDSSNILMVESRYPTVAEPFWALPGGHFEAGEGVAEALAREVKEETGLDVHGPISIVAVIWLHTMASEPAWVTFVCEPRRWSGGARADLDPDGVTTDVGFVPIDEAIDRLNALPWGMSHALIERLRGARAGAVWEYRWPGAGPFDGNGPAELIGRVDGSAPPSPEAPGRHERGMP